MNLDVRLLLPGASYPTLPGAAIVNDIRRREYLPALVNPEQAPAAPPAYRVRADPN